jgi:hypothetical protein
MKHFFSTRLRACLASLFMASPLLASAAPFTPGNIVVVRVGDGTAPLSGEAAATYLVEYTPAGVLVQTITLPTAANGANSILTNTGSSNSDAVLTRSANGACLVLTGYDAAPGTPAVAATTAGTNNRIIGRVAADGTVNTSTRISDAFSGNNIRSAATADGLNFYAVGSGSGVRYLALGNTGPTTALSTGTPTNNRAVNIFGGNLYVSSASSTSFGISQVGTGLPTTAAQAITQLPGFPIATGPSPYAFYFADLNAAVAGNDVIYIADERTAAEGGIQKWSLVGTTWVYNGSMTNATAVRGLSGLTTGAQVSLVASGTNGVYLVADNAGYNAAPTLAALPDPIVPAPAVNAVFRGVAFAPGTTVLGARARTALAGLTVSPNPATDRITVVLPRAGAATVALRDLTGRTVLTAAALAADQQLRLPAGLAAGVYLLEVRQGAETAVRRVEKN